MPKPSSPVFLPDNEPYLGSPLLKLFDDTIVKSMAIHRQLGARTYATDLSPLQIAAAEIIPQGVSIALSMRELIRQGYLFSAGILMRPLVERTGMIYYLHKNPDAVTFWHNGWPRKSQPNFDELLDLIMPSSCDEEWKAALELLHKLVHSDPKTAGYNSTTRSDGLRASAAGKELNEPIKADAISAFATRCLDRLTNISIKILGAPSEQIY
ncbi:conserved hypothetical protein [Candidatus Nitrotoga sp. HW29]|uniref:hypothetical protein n=1 Tax=Candidatus Nitrotoga sp. HW29 TaxID=2886963 RepID=UPI001EF1F535|nr:hypothetical protein [Candidatus Nitrotoga sp. HW29]CAH1904158.1 conserved hypothetical protein [Candidatus Nitrotoga sp. HW29]